ncbi:uncharacterized protein SAPINGB_P005683 [Magnusiomyces paraingens]|uniref:Rhodanese domain-containing protein n=1 Tax=Magnusiomyces paraingens TaxID=2606893 RepID=A0A5E8C181_9ASCO|nr:uncharacterized protein SAPINGB_P005683 [Saprochaete ingens]VVT57413.1 unnamed protein product [Saprochaete ingens]
MASPEIVNWIQSTPEPSVKPSEKDYLEPSAVAELIRRSPKDIAIIDLRKNDFVGGKIKGAFNIPAQSIYHSVDDLYDLFDKAEKKEIIVHCVSSRDRATRTWGWLTDYKNSKGSGPEIFILKGGFNAFKAADGTNDLIDN